MADWFVVNVTEAPALRHEIARLTVVFEPREDRFSEFGINLRVLEPGQPSGVYHAESAQEGFLVLSGEATLIIEGEERTLHAWDYVHCPAGTEHIIVGAGDGPSAILMIGARGPDKTIHYPVSDLAARHGASVTEATDSAAEAYAEWGANFTPTKLDWPPS
jgi:uncharacterized cupin superfamily protein